MEEFIKLKIDPSYSYLKNDNRELIAEIVLDYFEKQCPRIPVRREIKLDSIFSAVKIMRDKRVAHHEDHNLQNLEKADLDGILELLAFAQTFVNIVGYRFFGHSEEFIAEPSDFEPEKSEIWDEANNMLDSLEQVNIAT